MKTLMPSTHRRSLTSHRSKGFTIIELVAVIVITGIMAAVAIPRFADRSAFQARGFLDETKSLLRFAQKSAVAQRRNVCVALNSNGLTLTIDTSTPADGTCDGALMLPSTPKGGTGLATSPATPSFIFRPLGDTDRTANFTVAISGTSINVDYKTGYVY